MCCTQAKLALPFGGAPYCQRGSSSSLASAPFADVERRIGQHVVGAEVGMLVVGEGVGRFLAEIEVDAADGHVHRGEPPGGGVGLLAVNG